MNGWTLHMGDSKDDDQKRDELLRRMLNTPPDRKKSKDKDKSEEKEPAKRER